MTGTRCDDVQTKYDSEQNRQRKSTVSTHSTVMLMIINKIYDKPLGGHILDSHYSGAHSQSASDVEQGPYLA